MFRAFSPFRTYFTSYFKVMEMCVWVYKTESMREVSKYGAFSGPYFPVFGLNTEKYGPEKTPYLDTFHAVNNDGGRVLSKYYFLY